MYPDSGLNPPTERVFGTETNKVMATTNIRYFISTGAKSDFYTLWRERTIETGKNVTTAGDKGIKSYFVHTVFVCNLAKTREAAIAKVKEMGIDIPDSYFSDELKHIVTPTMEAYGATMEAKKGLYSAEATQAFWTEWRANKEEMKRNGWFVSKFDRNGKWYMHYRENA